MTRRMGIHCAYTPAAISLVLVLVVGFGAGDGTATTTHEVIGITQVEGDNTSLVLVDLESGDSQVYGSPAFLSEVFETAFSAQDDALYLLHGGANLTKVFLKNKTCQSVEVDSSQCDDGSPCFNELRYDESSSSSSSLVLSRSSPSRIIAIGVGYGKGKNSVVSINVETGKVQRLQSFDIECAVYLESSALDSTGGIFYAWLGCGTQARAQLVAFFLKQSKMEVLVEVGFRDVASPCVVVPGFGWVGIGSNGTVVRIKEGKLVAISAVVPGIPANNGMVSFFDSTGAPCVAVLLVNGEKGEVVTVNLVSGSVSPPKPLKWPVNYLHLRP